MATLTLSPHAGRVRADYAIIDGENYTDTTTTTAEAFVIPAGGTLTLQISKGAFTQVLLDVNPGSNSMTVTSYARATPRAPRRELSSGVLTGVPASPLLDQTVRGAVLEIDVVGTAGHTVEIYLCLQ